MTVTRQVHRCHGVVSIHLEREDGREEIVLIAREIPVDGTLVIRIRRQQVTVEEDR